MDRRGLAGPRVGGGVRRVDGPRTIRRNPPRRLCGHRPRRSSGSLAEQIASGPSRSRHCAHRSPSCGTEWPRWRPRRRPGPARRTTKAAAPDEDQRPRGTGPRQGGPGPGAGTTPRRRRAARDGERAGQAPSRRPVPGDEHRCDAAAGRPPGSGQEVRQALGAAQQVFVEVEKACTRFDPTSPLMRANGVGAEWYQVPQVCFEAIGAAALAHAETGGAVRPPGARVTGGPRLRPHAAVRDRRGAAVR